MFIGTSEVGSRSSKQEIRHSQAFRPGHYDGDTAPISGHAFLSFAFAPPPS